MCASQVNSKPNQKLNIVVTIAPFYNLVAAVNDDVNNLNLLIPNNISPHDFHLKPNDLLTLKKADLIIWGGKDIEPFLKNVLTQNIRAKVLDLSTTPNLVKLPVRMNQSWEPHIHAHEHEHEHEHSTIDPHIWLSIDNAKKITAYISKTLSQIDHNNSNTYIRNAKYFEDKLIFLKKDIKKSLQSIQKNNFLVFHDAYQYFEKENSLSASGSITLHPELPVSAKKIKELKNKVLTNNIKCIFSEPQFQPKIVNLLLENTTAKHGILDPLGNKHDLGKNGYLLLMTNLSNDLKECLQD